jgi:hypothetical protein
LTPLELAGEPNDTSVTEEMWLETFLALSTSLFTDIIMQDVPQAGDAHQVLGSSVQATPEAALHDATSGGIPSRASMDSINNILVSSSMMAGCARGVDDAKACAAGDDATSCLVVYDKQQNCAYVRLSSMAEAHEVRCVS